MGDFRFVRCLNGMTPQAELVTAGGAMEVGDLVIAAGDNNEGIATKVTKAAANAARSTIVGLCLGRETGAEDATIGDGDLIQILPLHVSGIILEGNVIDATLPNVNAQVGLDVTSTKQAFEAAETNKIGRVFKIINGTAAAASRVAQVILD